MGYYFLHCIITYFPLSCEQWLTSLMIFIKVKYDNNGSMMNHCIIALYIVKHIHIYNIPRCSHDRIRVYGMYDIVV